MPEAVLSAFRGVDLLLHLGHISSTASLDKLETVAQVLAVQTELDDQILGDSLAGEIARGRMKGRTRVIETAGVRIGAIHDLGANDIKVPYVEGEGLHFPFAPMSAIAESKFGMRVDVVAFAATHLEMVLYRDGVLLVNPGSPNLPFGRAEGVPGTFAILNLRDGTVAVEIVDLAR